MVWLIFDRRAVSRLGTPTPQTSDSSLNYAYSLTSLDYPCRMIFNTTLGYNHPLLEEIRILIWRWSTSRFELAGELSRLVGNTPFVGKKL